MGEEGCGVCGRVVGGGEGSGRGLAVSYVRSWFAMAVALCLTDSDFVTCRLVCVCAYVARK